MAHKIDMSNGRANMAFIGSRDAIWHGLGQELSPNSPIEVWQKEAGMDWVVKESKVNYKVDPDSTALFTFSGKKLLYRSDTFAGLSIVGEDFNIVQPKEVLEFFRDLTEIHGMVLSTAGVLCGGTRFWALAETGREGSVVNNDLIKGHLLFVTSVDGTLANTAKFVSTRVVCNNTLSLALNETGKIVRKTHRTAWDPTQVKIDLGILDSNWESFMSDLRLLGQRKMTDKEVSQFFKKTAFDPKHEEDDQPLSARKNYAALTDLYRGGLGSEYSYGTAYGALNAVTDLYTHGNGRKRVPYRKFWDAYFNNDEIKNNAMTSLLAMC